MMGGRGVWGSPPARELLAGAQRLHLGCGTNVLPGWVNVDAGGGPGVVALDLTRPLPVDSSSVDYVFSEHFIEHVTREEAHAMLAECFRVLRPGGVLRTSTPDARKLVEEYLAGRLTEWADVQWHPATPCRMLNEGMRLWGHQFLYDEPELTALLREIGFAHVARARWRESAHDVLRALECRPFHGEIIVEATR